MFNYSYKCPVGLVVQVPLGGELKVMQRGVMIVGLPTIVGKWFTAIIYLFRGPHITMDAHAKVRGPLRLLPKAHNLVKAAGKPFAIPSLSSYQVCISDPTQITELSNAPGQQLSLNEVIDEVRFRILPILSRVLSIDLVPV